MHQVFPSPLRFLSPSPVVFLGQGLVSRHPEQGKEGCGGAVVRFGTGRQGKDNCNAVSSYCFVWGSGEAVAIMIMQRFQ